MGKLRKEKYKKGTTLINALINIKSHGFYYYRSKLARSKLDMLVSKKGTFFFTTFYILTRDHFIEDFPDTCSTQGTVTGFGLTKDDLPF